MEELYERTKQIKGDWQLLLAGKGKYHKLFCGLDVGEGVLFVLSRRKSGLATDANSNGRWLVRQDVEVGERGEVLDPVCGHLG